MRISDWSSDVCSSDLELVRELIQEQKELEKFLEQVRREKKAADMTHEEQSPTSDEELLKKQEELQELFDKVLDEETKKIIAELEKLLEKNNKNLTREQLQNLQLDNKSLEKELKDRKSTRLNSSH